MPVLLQVRLLPKSDKSNIVMGRVRGVFVRPAADEKEPQRTERLLAHPLALFRGKPADAMDSMKLAWFQRSNGRGFVGLSYDFVAVMTGVAVAALNGIGPNIDSNSSQASMQVATIMSIQLCTSAYVFTFKPSADRIDNMLTGAQFLLEGSQTATLLYASVLRSRNSVDSLSALHSLGFWLGLLAIFIPIIEKVYDAIVNQVSAYCRGGFDPTGAFYATLALALAVPGVILQMLGFKSDTLASVTDSIDEAAATAEIAADEQLLHEASQQVRQGADFLSDVASDFFWMRTSAPHNKAATRMQANWRGARQRASVEHTDERATIIVEKWRSKTAARRKEMTEHRVATMLQRAFRGARERRKVELEGHESKTRLVQDARALRVRRFQQEACSASERQRRKRLVLRQKRERQLHAATASSSGHDTRHDVHAFGKIRHAGPPDVQRPGFDWLEKQVAASEDWAPLAVAATQASERRVRAMIDLLPQHYPPSMDKTPSEATTTSNVLAVSKPHWVKSSSTRLLQRSPQSKGSLSSTESYMTSRQLASSSRARNLQV